MSQADALGLAQALNDLATVLRGQGWEIAGFTSGVGLLGEGTQAVVAWIFQKNLPLLRGSWLATSIVGMLAVVMNYASASVLDQFAQMIRDNTGVNGLALAYDAKGVYGEGSMFLFLNRDTGWIAGWRPSLWGRWFVTKAFAETETLQLGGPTLQSTSDARRWYMGYRFNEDFSRFMDTY